MTDRPLTLPLPAYRPRRWHIVEGIDENPDGHALISLVITVSAAEAASCLRYLQPRLGPPDKSDFPGIDETTPATEPTEQHGVWQVVDRHGKVLADCPSHSEACKISGQLDLTDGDDSPHSVYFAMVPA